MLRKTKTKIRNQRSLNWPLLITTVAIAAVTGVGLYALNRYQVPQLSSTFLERADEAEANGDLETASKYLLRYIQSIEPEKLDSKFVVRMAETVARNATSYAQKQAAVKWYYRAAGVSEPNAALLGQLAKLLMETGQFSLAEEQASHGLVVDPQDKTCQIVHVLSRYGLLKQGRPIPIEEVTDKLAELNNRYPESIELATARAQVYRELNIPTNEKSLGETADRVMARLVDSNSSNFEAYLARYQYRVRFDLPDSDADVQRALELAPHEPNVILSAANSARKHRAFDKALDYYQTLTRIDSKNRQAHLGIGECLLAMGKTNMAIQAWNDGLLQSNLNDLSINVRLADTLIDLERLEDAQAAIDRVNISMQQLTSEGSERLRDWAVAARSLLEAKLLIAKQHYHDAIPLLRRVAVTTKSELNESTNIELSYQAWSWLGQCYWHLRQWEESAVSYERALAENPTSSSTRIEAAKSWAAVGRLEKAIMLAEQAALRENSSDAALVLLARLRLKQQLRFPAANRDWTQFEKILKLAEERAPDSWELPLHRVSHLFATEGHQSIGRCLELLLEAETSHGQNKDFLAQAVLMYQSLGLASEADRVLAKLESLTNTSFEALLVRSELLAHRGEFENALTILDSVEAKNNAQKQKLVDSKIGLALWAGDTNRVKTVLEQQAKTYPRNVQVLSQLTELSMRELNWDDFAKWQQRLKNVEGASGSLWRYFEARKILDSNRVLSESDYESLWTLFEQLDRIRPWWPGNTLLKAMIAEHKNDPAAIEYYIETLRHGLRTPEVYQRLIQLLQEKGELVEAEQYVRLMVNEHAPSQSISGLAISTASQRGQIQLAVELAKKNVQRDPSSSEARVWLAKTLFADGRTNEAEEELARASALAPDNLLVYSARFTHFFSTNQRDTARDVLDEMETNARLPEIQKHFVLAQSYQLLNDRKKAAASFEKILRLSPNNVDFLIRYAMFLTTFDTKLAEAKAKRATEIDPSSDAARRTLAIVLSWSKNPEAWQQAQQLLDYLPQSSGATDQRLNAILLLRRGGENDLQAAENILQRLVEKEKASSDDLQMLAALLEQRGAVEEADKQFQAIVSHEFVTSKHLSAYVEFLFRHKRFDDANASLVKLEKQAPNSLSAVRLRAIWFASKNLLDEIKPYVNDFAETQLSRIENPGDKERFMLQIAQLFATLNQSPASEEWLIRLNEAFPGNEQHLAMHFARTKQAQTALDICTNVLEEHPSASMTVVLAKVLLFGATEHQIDSTLDRILNTAVARFPEDSELLFYVANVNLKYGRNEKAIELYRQLVKVNPKHTLAWNNIAALLAEEPRSLDTALKCVDRAIREAGYKIPILLDTKATVLMKKGKDVEAAEILQDVVKSSNGNDPRFHFHLSIALNRIGKKQEAIEAFRSAIDLGLEKTYLTDGERDSLKTLQQELL